MKVEFGKVLRALSLSISMSAALVGTTAIVVALTTPDIALAKNGKGGGGNGGGNGGGKGGGNGGGNGNDNDGGKGHGGSNGKGSGASADKGKSAKSATRSGHKAGQQKRTRFSLKKLFEGQKDPKTKRIERTISKPAKTSNAPKRAVRVSAPVKSIKPKAAPRTKANRMAALLGVHPSELGALNAANANQNAFANASPNSRVGKIADFRNASIVLNLLRDALDEKKDELAGLTPPERPLAEIEAAREFADAEAAQISERVSELEAALVEAGGTDPQIESELASARADLDAAQATADSLAEEQQTAEQYQQAVSEVEALTGQVDEQDTVARAALEDAANKPVTDQVEAAVRSILGL
ncbi:hypothetical protein [uncultured Tateyamaria sp.]|uniref:hypothetical protein n=1 Tax=uncultured Tateyamaria sp. TaxID=455651 RepID=UPI0026060A55|nr:hypothetical protein [uncultured Tateyamaria sp.]